METIGTAELNSQEGAQSDPDPLVRKALPSMTSYFRVLTNSTFYMLQDTASHLPKE